MNDWTSVETSIPAETPGFDADLAVLIAADSWQQLRRSDVLRLFDWHQPRYWTEILRVLTARRPELVDEAHKCLAELEEDTDLATGGGFGA